MILDITEFLHNKDQKVLSLTSVGKSAVCIKGRSSVYLVPRACPHQGINSTDGFFLPRPSTQPSNFYRRAPYALSKRDV